jgi:hypothetical protein
MQQGCSTSTNATGMLYIHYAIEMLYIHYATGMLYIHYATGMLYIHYATGMLYIHYATGMLYIQRFMKLVSKVPAMKSGSFRMRLCRGIEV